MAKENLSKMKREPTIWEDIFANDTSDKGLTSGIHKELTWLHSKKTNNPIKKHICTLMFTTALFTIAKCWKQPKCPSVSEWTKNCGTFTQWNTKQQKERRSFYLLWQHEWTGEHYGKWNKPDSEGQIPYDLTFNWNIINRRKKQIKYNQRHWS